MNNEDIIRLLRKRLEKLSQSELARELDVSPQFVYDILRGARQPSERVLSYLGLKREIVRVK